MNLWVRRDPASLWVPTGPVPVETDTVDAGPRLPREPPGPLQFFLGVRLDLIWTGWDPSPPSDLLDLFPLGANGTLFGPPRGPFIPLGPSGTCPPEPMLSWSHLESPSRLWDPRDLYLLVLSDLWSWISLCAPRTHAGPVPPGPLGPFRSWISFLPLRYPRRTCPPEPHSVLEPPSPPSNPTGTRTPWTLLNPQRPADSPHQPPDGTHGTGTHQTRRDPSLPGDPLDRNFPEVRSPHSPHSRPPVLSLQENPGVPGVPVGVSP